MRAWLKRQEKAKAEKRMEEKELKQMQMKMAKKWQPNELFDNNPSIPIKLPNIQSLFMNDAIENAVNAIENDSESDIDRHEFEIYSLFVIERLPIINRVFEYQETYRSLLRDIKLQQSMPHLFKELYVDQIKKYDREKEKNLKIRPRITAMDDSDECHSLNRCLDRRLYLVCKQKDKEHWEFPWAKRMFDETLFETANRALVDRVGPYLHYATISSEPFGHTQYQYHNDDENNSNGNSNGSHPQNQKTGAQLFFQKGYYVKGNGRADINASVQDFGWFPKHELSQKINPVLWQSIEQLLLE